MFLANYDGLSEELVEPRLARLIDKNAAVAYRHHGVWACMDTFNDEQRLEQRTARGRSGSGLRIRATGTWPRDLVSTRDRGDLQRDHRRVAELTWNTFRNRLVLESEIPECDGDFGSPNLFVELDEELARRKTETSMGIFGRQECAAARRHAEGFYCRKTLQGRGR
jgi:hypothetical protein